MIRCSVFVLLLAAVAARAADDCNSRHEFDQIVSEVTHRFYDQTFRGLDWPARVRHYRNALSCGAESPGVALVVNQLLSELHASHTKLYTRADMHYWGLNSLFSPNLTDFRLNFAGIWPEQQNGRWFAKYVLEGSPAARAGVARGDELLQLNDAPFSPFAFTGHADSLVVRSVPAARRTLAVTAEYVRIMQAFIDASKASTRTIELPGKRVGYFHLWTAQDSILQALSEALAGFEASRVDALIVDLRGGYGGTSPDYLDPLRASPHLMSVPKFFLIDDGVRSGKEMLAAMVKKEKLGTLVGSRTKGAFLVAVPVRPIDGKYFLLVAGYGSLPVDLPPIEGVGVRPDIEVALCSAFCGGRDAPLEKALALTASGRLLRNKEESVGVPEGMR